MDERWKLEQSASLSRLQEPFPVKYILLLSGLYSTSYGMFLSLGNYLCLWFKWLLELSGASLHICSSVFLLFLKIAWFILTHKYLTELKHTPYQQGWPHTHPGRRTCSSAFLHNKIFKRINTVFHMYLPRECFSLQICHLIYTDSCTHIFPHSQCGLFSKLVSCTELVRREEQECWE